MGNIKDLYITKEKLRTEYGLDLENFAIDETAINSLINLCVGKVITAIYKLNDEIESDQEIYDFLIGKNKVATFEKLQYATIYNYLYISGDDPMTTAISDIIVYELKLSKINGIQKGVYNK